MDANQAQVKERQHAAEEGQGGQWDCQVRMAGLGSLGTHCLAQQERESYHACHTRNFKGDHTPFIERGCFSLAQDLAKNHDNVESVSHEDSKHEKEVLDVENVESPASILLVLNDWDKFYPDEEVDKLFHRHSFGWWHGQLDGQTFLKKDELNLFKTYGS